MQVQFDNRLISSFLLMIDHEVQKRGAAYYNYSGLFYPAKNSTNNIYTYTSPFKQLSNDTSVTGANIISGVYVNGTFVTVGQSGLRSINHYQGAVNFNSQLPASTAVSGRYAVKEFNVELVDQQEWKLLFDTKFISNNQYNQVLSGLALDTKITPAIFIRSKVQENKPFSIGGLEDNIVKLRAVVIAENEFQKVAVCSILKNLNYRPVNIVNSTPFDALGNMTGINYNYEQLSFDTSYHTWILGVKYVDVPQVGQFKDILRNMAIIDFDISTIIRHSY